VQILITDHVFADLELTRGILDPLGGELVVAPATDEATLVELARGTEAMIVCYAKVTRAVIEAATECRVIARTGIGYDNIDVAAASEHGILVTYVPDYCLDEVADHTIALLLAAARGVVEASRSVREGGWSVPEQSIHSLRGRQLTLVGIGRIGAKVAERALVFGLRVVAYDPFVAEPPLDGIELVSSLDEALAEADIVSLHVPMSAENHHLIGESAIAKMKRAPILVNTSRGGLVDLDAVTAALDDGRLSVVALDVTEPEPLPDGHPLRTHSRAIVTPHIAFHSVEAQDELQRRAADEVARALRNESPRSPVNADALASTVR
jgi:D-3-phosphoglycerate dehydrogenase / 2-oxoglutarate reductase